MINVSSCIISILVLILLTSCNNGILNEAIYVSVDEKIVALKKGNKYTLLHSGAPHYCDELILESNDQHLINRSKFRSKSFKSDSFYYRINNDSLLIGTIAFIRKETVYFDSLVIQNSVNNKFSKSVILFDKQLPVQSLASIVEINNFQGLDSTFIAHKQNYQYMLYENGKVKSEMKSAVPFFCIPLEI